MDKAPLYEGHTRPSKPTYNPKVIIHGGAGAISRTNLPPNLYIQYHDSLLKYLEECQALVESGVSALDASCHAVALMEDDPLFNCGRGSVFTRQGTIEMEASVMVAAIDSHSSHPGSIKRGAAVSLVQETRHPISLARAVLLAADAESGLGGTDTMHCHLSGPQVESWGFEKVGLERKSKDWFWTKRRWDEHRRGLHGSIVEQKLFAGDQNLPSQGTVGAVCVDRYGNMAVATSTGGLTNKSAGRIGDTPTMGAGFWAESWITAPHMKLPEKVASSTLEPYLSYLPTCFRQCLGVDGDSRLGSLYSLLSDGHSESGCSSSYPQAKRRAIAMSGTGNGDSFLRTDAVRTAAALCRFSGVSLRMALRAVAGPNGELQNSAGKRWRKSGEGEGGIIGIELSEWSTQVAFDFNCGGLWRAWYEEGCPRVMVFRDEY